MTKHKRLGRGLAALIGDDYAEDNMVLDARTSRHVPIEFLRRNPENPRKSFPEAELQDLTNSIREKGLLQPIIVRPVNNGDNAVAEKKYEIVAGERRWRAAQKAGLHDVLVIIREISDGEAFEIALIENIQRADLDPVEEAQGYRQLMDKFGYTQERMAESLGKSRSHIANMLRLLKLPESIQAKLSAGELTSGHARALITADDPKEIARQIMELGLNVREAENLVREKAGRKPPAKKRIEKDPNTIALEHEVSSAIGMKVDIASKDEAGQLRISFKTLEQLDDVIMRLIRPVSSTGV